ncbi:MAG: hypothetical protein JO235_00485 [Chroococcidiopsidaceae cyanobacterium CP_BM_RX_35]|nr:hypothetical protein [Chroococcidiopsidaceae cyanobacterium CP_BM_RX_35]
MLEIARHGELHVLPETDLHLEEFAMRIALSELHHYYPGEKLTQQLYHHDLTVNQRLQSFCGEQCSYSQNVRQSSFMAISYYLSRNGN